MLILRRSLLRVNSNSFGRICAVGKFSLRNHLRCFSSDVEFGDVVNSHIRKAITEINELRITQDNSEQYAWIRGRVETTRVSKGAMCFLVVRSNKNETIQCCSFKDKTLTNEKYISNYASFIQFVQELPNESLIEVYGKLSAASVKSCTQKNIEVHINKIEVISRASKVLPFPLKDELYAALHRNGTEDHGDEDSNVKSELSDSKSAQVVRYDNRWLHLRIPVNNSILRVQSHVGRLFREFLYEKQFIEIHTPKIVAGSSEGGADVFNLSYFNQEACLAQSPQLYKQMAISSDFNRVFEVAPVFRAEKSLSKRHLCEFTGLDLEMEIQHHYHEILNVIHNVFKHIFHELESNSLYNKDIQLVRSTYTCHPVVMPDQPLIIKFAEGVQLLRENGVNVNDFDDFSTLTEIKLGELIKQKYNSDFFILDKYPSAIRPFYTMKCADNPLYSHSYDVFLRGQEICSGAQRCHDPDRLVKQIVEKGLNPKLFDSYVRAFKHGMSPHGGGGIGLERVVFLYLGLDNIRKASMFPRTPNRLTP